MYCDLLWQGCYALIKKNRFTSHITFNLQTKQKNIGNLLNNTNFPNDERDELLIFYRLSILAEHILKKDIASE